MKLVKQGMPVLVALNQLMEFYGKDYVFPAQNTICQRLKDWYGVGLSRRQLNRVLAGMESGGLIHRTRRHVRHKRRGMLFRSTLYHITLQGWRSLYTWGCVTKSRFLEMLARVKRVIRAEEKPEGPARIRGGFSSLGDLLKGFKGVFL